MIETLYDAMAIPESCHLGKPVYKKQFHENAKLGPTDKKALSDDVGKVKWQYTFKPETIQIESYEDQDRRYLEVALLQVDLKQTGRVARLAEIVHRAIPYPLILVFLSQEDCLMSLANKRFSQVEEGAYVVEQFQDTGWIQPANPNEHQGKFLSSLAINDWPHTNFYAFYSAAMDRVLAMACADLCGSFHLEDPEDNPTRSQRLTNCRALEKQINELRSAIKKEQQFNRKFTLSTSLKELEDQFKQEAARL